MIKLHSFIAVTYLAFCGMSSENAAHRIAVLWDTPAGETREGVFIPRRDTGKRGTSNEDIVIELDHVLESTLSV